VAPSKAEPPYDERHRVRDPEIEAHLRTFAARLTGDLPDDIGFTLFLFPFHDRKPSGVFYISNAQRADVILTLEAWLAQAKRDAR
jgi:hypothetical protein